MSYLADDDDASSPPAQKKLRGKKDKEGDLAKKCAAGSAGKCSKYKLGKDDETPKTQRYKDNQDPIDGMIDGLKDSNLKQQKNLKALTKCILSSPDLSGEGKKQRMKTNLLNQLHLLYASEQIAKDLGRQRDVNWFRAVEAETRDEIMEVDYYSVSSSSDSSSCSDDESSSSDGDKKLPSK